MPATLPHDDYMTAVAGALTAYGLEPDQWWSCEDDSGTPDSDRLDGVFQWRTGTANPEHWPHGVYLTWDQYDGWRLIEEGGGRTIHVLSEDSRTYSHPRQIAADVRSRFDHGLDGYTPGPICIAGGHWDPKATHDAVLAWQA
ncbi:hypothetical protein PL81_38670 [Streptomyces sp. RSD-27]|nr:hypothetical protein PL81_38670 [Streptomyces sp. RSD-27]